MRKISYAITLWLFTFVPAIAQTPPAPSTPSATLSTRSTLVLVPTLVRTKAGEPVFTLTANDFLLTDDGVEQKVALQEDADGDPLALVVVVQTGGSAARQLDRYQHLGLSLEAMVGNVPHKVAVVAFGSTPGILQGFTADFNRIDDAMNNLAPDDGGAAIVDALNFAVDLLRKQPPQYRRAILLLSETIDHGSKLKVEEAVRAVSDTNTAIYSLAFSSTRTDLAHEASHLNRTEPGPAGGCMSKDTSASSDPPSSRFAQLWDCLSMLAPPLRAATMLGIVGNNSLRRNVPETVAQLTGGEFLHVSDTRSLERGLQTFANHVPNRYMLTFHPQAPRPGFHYLALHLRDHPGLVVSARNSYWADTTPSTP